MLRQIEGRPLVLACISLIAGMVTRIALPCFVLALALFFFIRKPYFRGIVLAFCFLGFLVNKPIHVKSCIEPEFFKGNVTVTSMPMPSSKEFRCEVESKGVGYEMRYSKPKDLCLGDRIRVTGVIYPPSEIRDRLFQSKQLRGSLRPASDGIKRVRQGWVVWRWAADWRSLSHR
jgi:hypothetical protein